MPPRRARFFQHAFGFVALVMATGFSVAGQACDSALPASDLIKAGTLVMSTNPTLPPLQYVDSSGALKGMRITLGTDIADRLCLKPEYVRVDFDAMVPGLAAGRWDMIDTGIFFTPARVKIMQMIPYEQQAISISVPKAEAAKFTKIEDLAGKTVGVEIGGFEEQALGAGQVNAVVSIDGVAKEYADRGAFARPISGLFPTPVALAFKDRPLAEAVAKVLNAMKADGSYDKLFEQYGLAPMPGPFAVQGPT
jgi:polar amino acid transport system substrate-binding protein